MKKTGGSWGFRSAAQATPPPQVLESPRSPDSSRAARGPQFHIMSPGFYDTNFKNTVQRKQNPDGKLHPPGRLLHASCDLRIAADFRKRKQPDVATLRTRTRPDRLQTVL